MWNFGDKEPCAPFWAAQWRLESKRTTILLQFCNVRVRRARSRRGRQVNKFKAAKPVKGRAILKHPSFPTMSRLQVCIHGRSWAEDKIWGILKLYSGFVMKKGNYQLPASSRGISPHNKGCIPLLSFFFFLKVEFPCEYVSYNNQTKAFVCPASLVIAC